MDGLIRGPGASVLDELESGAPAEKEQRQDAAGHDDERQTYPSAGEQPQGHADDDGAQPNCDARSQRERMPPGAPEKRPDQTPSEKRPSRVRHAQQVGRLLVAAASDDRKDQDADHVHRNRWKDLHEAHTTLRPWPPQPIVMSPLPRARSWLLARAPGSWASRLSTASAP